MTKILLAEDDPTMLGLLTTLLKLEGFSTVNLSVQEKILEVIDKEKPDVILLDVHLHQSNGIDMVKEIRANNSLKNVLIIMQSGMNLMDECIKIGANDFLLKPYLPSSLIDSIRKGLSKTQLVQ